MAREADMTIDIEMAARPKLRPGNAVAALITIGGSYLLQLRDNIDSIFFPDHWGCFGGAVEEGESGEQALIRELREELEFNVPPTAIHYFTRFDFDLAFSRMAPIYRFFYEIEISEDKVRQFTLHEGAAMRVFSANDVMRHQITIAPYDAFALWLHINRARIS